MPSLETNQNLASISTTKRIVFLHKNTVVCLICVFRLLHNSFRYPLKYRSSLRASSFES